MSSRSGNIRVRAASQFTSTGPRPVQEDFTLSDREKGIFVIADGFGGPGPGLTAAKTACESVRAFLFKEAGDLEATLPFVLRNYFSLAGNVLFNALIHANRRVTALNRGKTANDRGGASVLAGFIDGDLLALANVGVCTAFLLRDGKATELVSPRSYAKLVDPLEQSASGELDAPLIALGTSEDLEPEIFEYRLKPGDWVILKTDGVPESAVDQLRAIQGVSASVDAESSVRAAIASCQDGPFSENATLSLLIF
ncbi:MAG: PP2C family protein-serine/threonine phosphatase [Bdellovibrionota bacterium]